MVITGELKKEVIYSDEPNRLYEIMIEVTEEISVLHTEVVKNEDNIKKTESRGKISVLNILLNIIEKKIDDVKASDIDKDRKELYINRQFKMAAELVLQKETFERIRELSLMNYKKFKESRTELKINKME